MKISVNKNSIRRHGVTLVEILVVISIMSVLTVLIIPRVRTINKDRNIRESARVVGSMFANAAQRAAAEGKQSGVLIERAKNNNRVATTLYLMRSIPDYAGDDESMGVWRPGANLNTCRIDKPFEEDIVQINDRIFFNNQRFGYRITGVDPDPTDTYLDLTIETVSSNGQRSTYPEPALPTDPTNSLPFRIERRPRVIESSAVGLPAGYEIDLRYSGWFINDSSSSDYNKTMFDTVNEDIEIIFNESGGLDSAFAGANKSISPTSSLYLFVSENDLELGSNQDPLVRDANLWVTVNHLNGGTSIGYNASPGNFVNNDVAELRQRITTARGLATNRQDAAQ